MKRPTTETTGSFPVNLIQKDGDVPVLLLHEEVGATWWDDNSSKAWAEALNGLDCERLRVRINSVGGSAWDGIAIYQLLRDHPAAVDVVVDGIAASAASVVAMAGDTITMGDAAMMMIHDTSGMCAGNAADMRKYAEALDVCSNSIAAVYAKRAGGTVDEWRARMGEETWMTAEETVALGLSDRIDKTVKAAQNLLAAPVGRPPLQRPALTAVISSLPATGPDQTNQPPMEGTTMADALTSGLQARLGLPDDATEDMIFAALDSRLNQPEKPAHYQPPDGTTLVDSVQWDRVSRAAADFVAYRHNQILDQALAEGRITPANREKWAERLTADETGAVEILNELPADSAVHMTEVGHAGQGPAQPVNQYGQTPKEATAYDAVFPKSEELR
jgi:ATP-dependent protease ClpP protease subunit